MKKIKIFLAAILILGIIFNVHFLDSQIYSINNENGKYKIYSEDGKVISSIPDGFDVKDTGEGFIITNKNAGKDALLEIVDYKINLKSGSRIILDKKINRDKQVINLDGEADIEIGEKKLVGIKDAYVRAEAFKTRDGKIMDVVAARFTSVSGGVYSFSYGFSRITFNAKPGAEINFDPYWDINAVGAEREFKKIEAQNSDLILDNLIVQSGKFSLGFDKNNNINSIEIFGDGKIINNGDVYSSNNLKVFLGSEDLSNFNGNAISIDNKKQEVLIKGEIKLESKKGLIYNGLSKDSYTKFYQDINLFDMMKGNANIDNGKHKISIENGIMKLERGDLDIEKIAESFSVKTKKGDVETRANIIEEIGSFSINSYENGKITQTSMIPLSTYEGKLENVPEIQKIYVDDLKNILEKLKSSGESQDKINALELSIINAEIENNNIDDKISKIKEYLDKTRETSLDKENEINAKMRLAELYTQRVAQKKSEDDYKNAESIYLNIILKESEKTNKEAIEAAKIGWADLLRMSGKLQEAENTYSSLYLTGVDSSEETKSKAHVGTALTELSRENYARTLQELKRALMEDPSNQQAKEMQAELRLKILDGLSAQNDEIMSKRKQEFEKTSGIGENLLTSGRSFWNPITGRDRTLWEEYEGVIDQNNDFYNAVQALRTVSEKNYDMSIFLLGDDVIMQDIVSDYKGFGIIKSSEIEEYLETKGRSIEELYDSNGNIDIEKRYQIIKNWKGEKIASLDRGYAEASKSIVEGVKRAFEIDSNLRMIASDGFSDKIGKIPDYNTPNFHIDFENKDRYKPISENFYDNAVMFFSPKDIAIYSLAGSAARALAAGGRIAGIGAESFGIISSAETKIAQSTLLKTGSFIAKESGKIAAGYEAEKLTTEITGNQQLGQFVGAMVLSQGAKTAASRVLGAEAKAGAKGIVTRSEREIAEEISEFVASKQRVAGEIVHEAHNTANFQRLLEQYKFAQSHGVALEEIESSKAWETFYHAYPKGTNPDFSRGLDATMSKGGFFFTKSELESKKVLVDMGLSEQNIGIIKISVSRNVYDPSAKKALVKAAPTWESGAYFVPVNKYNKFNELMDKGLIKIGQ